MTDPDERPADDGRFGAAPVANDSSGSVLDDDPVPTPEPVGHALDDEPDDGDADEGGAAGIWRNVEPDAAVAFLEQPPVEDQVPRFVETGAAEGLSDPPVVVVDSAFVPAGPVEFEVPPIGDFAPSYDVTVLPIGEPDANGPAAGHAEGGAAAEVGWIVVEPQQPFAPEPVSAAPPPVDAPQVLPWGDGTATGWMVVDPDESAAPAPTDGPIVEIAPDPTGPASEVDVGDLVLHRPGDPLVPTEVPVSAADGSPFVVEPEPDGDVGTAAATGGEAGTETKRAPRTRRPRRDASFKSLLPAVIAGPITIVVMYFLLPLFGLRLPTPWSSKPSATPQRNVPVKPAPAPRKKKPKKTETEQTGGPATSDSLNTPRQAIDAYRECGDKCVSVPCHSGSPGLIKPCMRQEQEGHG